MIDLFAISPNDRHALGELIDRLARDCDTEQVERFLADFAHWHRIQHRRVSQREYDAARRALQEWQDFVNGSEVTL